MSIKRLVRKVLNLRNYAMSDVWQISSGQASYSKFTLQRAVKEGYRVNPTVYRAVYLITKAGASVPWMVYNEKNEPLPDHHISKLFKHPNPFISRQDMFELLISWLQLAGKCIFE